MDIAKERRPGKPKNIVICSDGTGNSANKDRGTNVFKLYEAVDYIEPSQSANERKQIAIYDDGVGTESFKPLRVLGGAFGWGLSRNVRELYAALVRSYRPGDRIFLFGFSRGAFTVRSLGGFITACGLLRREQFKSDADLLGAVEDAYATYRARYMTGARRDIQKNMRRMLKRDGAPRSPFDAKVESLHDDYKFHEDNKIAFMGVWDTVDAVGIPFDHLAAFINYFIYPFKFSGQDLSPDVEQGRHALAIDDERHTFHPLMWTEQAPGDHERIKQVWFAGVHSNIGGGYPKQGMSLVSLEWMMNEAAKAGLRFVQADRDYCRNHENVNDKLYNSRAGLAVYYRYKPRDIDAFCKHAGARKLIHDSVVDRIVQCTEGYAPGNLPAGLEIVANGDAAPRYPHAAAIMDGEFGKHASLLDRVKLLVWIRRRSHYIFIGLTVLALWVAAAPALPEGDVVERFRSISSIDFQAVLLDAFMTNWVFDVIVAGIAIFFVFGLWADQRMRCTFSEVWHKLAPRLSKDEQVAPDNNRHE